MNSLSSPTNEYIYTLKLNRPAILTEGPTPEEANILSAHWDYVSGLHRDGIIFFCGRTTDNDAWGIVVFKCASWEMAEKTMKADPSVKEGVMRGEVFPFQVFLKENPSVSSTHK